MQEINPEIEFASTIDKSFYLDQKIFEASKTKIFEKSWHMIGDIRTMNLDSNSTYPFTLLGNYIDEPLVLTSKNGTDYKCLSNVCTHRGFILSEHPTSMKKITCKYHGRRFDLDGKMEFMPEFKEVQNFPRDCDHLQGLEVKKWRQFLFTSIDPQIDFDQMFERVEEKIGFLPIDQFKYAPEYTKEYLVKANWALYCDNYLEGFHIPFVHNDLNNMLDYGNYTTQLYEHCNVQIGFADTGSDAFELPIGHPEYGKKVTAYYFWLFPNMMLNVYNYGLQINIVKPISIDRCKVQFLFYLYDEEAFKKMNADTFSEKVEREDEFVVEAVQKGLNSRYYQNGRFSAKREKGVHHFHQLAYQFLNE